MQDVIFNGSGNRKPVARASVELVFDNSGGRAAGQWSQYAEIAVKRVLQRDAESSYFINNIRVRRKDIADIFLGTGLGGNAYAIIEQGMISRIIDANPEELKVFLEEAAGISKYRERRRETESHLSATRENLLRVEDILREIVSRIGHLEVQAHVAKTYRELQAQLKTAQDLLWLRKKIQAGETRQKLSDEAARLETAIEAETANLRHFENLLTGMRDEHDAAGRALQEKQGAMYQANADVSRLQQEIDHVRITKARVEARIGTMNLEIEALEKQSGESRESLQRCEDDLAQSRRYREACASAFDSCKLTHSAVEQAARAARAAFDEARQALAASEQEEKIEQTHFGHACRMLDQLGKRRGQLLQLQQSLPPPDENRLAQLDGILARIEIDSGSVRRASEEEAGRLDAARVSRQRAASQFRENEKRLTGIRARLHALEDIQKQLEQASSLKTWLTENRLERHPRLWSKIRVESGWEEALESVLRERVNAIPVDASWQGPSPPGEVVLVHAGEPEFAETRHGLEPLFGLLTFDDPAYGRVLGEWLAGAYIAQDMTQARALRSKLGYGEILVTPQGHILTRHSIHYYGPDTRLHGVLMRQQEIESLRNAEAEAVSSLDTSRQSLQCLDHELAGTEAALKAAQAQLAKLGRESHDLQLQRLKAAESNERAVQQADRIELELAEIDAQLAAETTKQVEIEARISDFREKTGIARELSDGHRLERENCEKILAEQNRLLQDAARKSQEAEFKEKSCLIKIGELQGRLEFLSRNLEQSRCGLDKLKEEISTLDAAPLEIRLQQALTLREAREAALLQAREASEVLSLGLKDTDRMRQESELKLAPMREKLNDVRLKEQEARISAAQFDEFLGNSGANEDELGGMLDSAPKGQLLQAEISKLSGKIESLGAVNLAAFEELEAARERKNYLDSQFSDLSMAVETLENAIRRIDRETRERLMLTFDEVNRNLGELFHQLFGGGQARLILSGEQIIDSGMEIEAQPPGKKNASIRLLSGGEKALVALSLVFALFKLNPAPFCLLDEVDAPLDDSNTERFCAMVRKMAEHTQFLFISHNRITMEMAHQLIGVTMQEQGVSRIVAVDVETATGKAAV